MPAPRDWRLYFAFVNQLAVTLGTFVLAILLLANKSDIEASEMRFAVKGVAVQKFWIPMFAFGFFLQAGFSAAASIGVWFMSRWAFALYVIAEVLAGVMLAMTILVTTYIGWVAGFFLVLHAVGLPLIFATLVHRRFQPQPACES